MSAAKELKTIGQQELQQVPASGGLSPMVQAVMRGELTPDALSQLLQIQKDYEADVARKAFHKAVAEFKANAPSVRKDKTNKQYDSRYTSLENMVNTVNPHLSEFRLNAHWEIDQTDKVKVTCVLSHELGHCESTSMTAPPDTSGQKNPIQQIKSTITYLKLATYESIIGVASREGSASDDGNGAGGGQEYVNAEQIANIEALLTEIGANRVNFLKAIKCESIGDLLAKDYAAAVQLIEQRRKQK